MKFKRYNKKTSILIGLIVLNSVLAFGCFHLNSTLITNQVEVTPRSSNSWVLFPFIIDDTGAGDYTWAEAALKDWCSGLGTLQDPYVIENIMINGLNSSSCLTIRNSDKYFTIQYCTFYNAGLSPNAGLELEHVQNGFIYRNNVSCNNRWGIHLHNCYNNNIFQNLAVKNTGNNIFLSYCSKNVVEQNNASDGDYTGIKLENSFDNTVYNNTVVQNQQAGINVSWKSSNNTVAKNVVKNNDNYGVWLDNNSTKNIIRNNLIENNNYGIGLWQGCNETVIKGNIIKDNTQYGLSIHCYTGIHSDRNLIYTNSFISNTNQAQDDGLNNNWDNGVIGNHWSDYSGVDADDNGIGDTPYFISGIAGSLDHYPLMDLDLVEPHVKVLAPSSNEVFEEVAPFFIVEISDNNLSSSWYTLDGGLNNYPFTTNGTINQTAWDLITDGQVAIQFYANDTSGNIGMDKVIVKKDTEAPILNMIYPTPGEFFGLNSPEFNVEVLDLCLDSMWYTIDGGLTNITYTMNGKIDQNMWDALPDGPVTIDFYANDTVAHINTIELIINKDSTIPTIHIISPDPFHLFGADSPNYIVEISTYNLYSTWYTLDDGLNFRMFTDNGTIDPVYWNTMPNGTINIIFYANNTLGHVSSEQVSIQKDIIAPTIEIMAPNENNVFEQQAPKFELKIMDSNLDFLWYSINDDTHKFFLTEYAGIIDQDAWNSLPEGELTLRFGANDSVGNTNYKEVLIHKNLPEAPPGLDPIVVYTSLGAIGGVAGIAVTASVIGKMRGKKSKKPKSKKAPVEIVKARLFCPNCHSIVKPGEKFCDNCGTFIKK